jgi:hypothetical protein
MGVKLRLLRIAAAAASVACFVPLPAPAQTVAPQAPKAAVTTGWTTYHHDNTRDGYDPLAPTFAGGPFSNWNQAVDQAVYAEPLALAGVVYVATMGDSIYAFNATTGAQVWARTGTTALGAPSTGTFCSFSPGHIGIMGTPVIDPVAHVIYAVGLVTAPSVRYQLFALNLSDGSDVTGFPVDLSVSPNNQNERAALALANGHVYIAFGGWLGDCGTYHPAVVSVPTTGVAEDHTYQPQGTGQNGAGIWGSSGIAVDGSGNLFVATGNGQNSSYGSTSFPCTNTMWDHGNGVIKLSSTLAELASWAPDNSTQNWCALSASDTDIGSIGPALLPGNTLFQTGKSGYGWLLNSTAPGGFDGQQFQGRIGTCSPEAVFGGQAYYNGRLYVPCDGVGLVAFSVNTTTHTFNTTPDWVDNISPGPPIAAMGLIWTRNQAGTTLYGLDPATGQQRVSTTLGGGSNHFGTLAEDGGWIFVPHGAAIRAFNFKTPPCLSTSSTNWKANCSYAQYQLSGSNGSAWTDMDATNLSITFTPAVDSYAVLSGNVDLWTSSAGYNQDAGIAVSGGLYPTAVGQPEAWKESGGGATFSPNAAFVQTVIPVLASTAYTATLQWKANRADPGSIFAGAGPLGSSGFSPSRISVMLVPAASGRVFSAASTTQYSLSGSAGATWQDIDGTNLSLPFTPPTGSWLAFASGNADLFTSSAGYNQDIGVTLTGGLYPTAGGQPEAWKESGGFAGTFSPNAAFVQAPLPVAGGTAYTARLQWKANKPDPGTIWAGAGPVNAHYSPTALTVVLIPSPAGAVVAGSTQQYSLANSTGAAWLTMSSSALQLTLSPSVNSNYLVTANSDLWTAVAGYNQDIGIMISGGTFGTGTLLTWKESGGIAGAFSPNAAFALGDVALVGGNSYTLWIVWKANRAAAGATIHAGAGPVNGHFSPTWLTATLLN